MVEMRVIVVEMNVEISVEMVMLKSPPPIPSPPSPPPPPHPPQQLPPFSLPLFSLLLFFLSLLPTIYISPPLLFFFFYFFYFFLFYFYFYFSYSYNFPLYINFFSPPTLCSYFFYINTIKTNSNNIINSNKTSTNNNK